MERFEKLIMEENRHLFIYGYDTDERRKFCKSLEDKYPVLLDKDTPMAIYLEEYGFPKYELSHEQDKLLITTLSREYLHFLIVYKILLNSIERIGLDELEKRMSKIISVFNRCFRNSEFSELKKVEDLKIAFYDSIEFYLSSYTSYVLNKEKIDISKVSIPFMNLDMFVSLFKEVLNKNSYFGIIINNNQDVALSSVKEINDLVGSRINGDISMKIVTDPDRWASYIGTSRGFIEYIHDYGTISLDNSLEEHMKTLKKTRLN